MKYKILYFTALLLIFFINNSSAQINDSLKVKSDTFCYFLIRSEFEKSLITVLGKEYVFENFKKKDDTIYASITMDSLARVVESKILKFNNLTPNQVMQIESDLTGKTLCLINSDPHLSFEEFIKLGNNRFKVRIPYNSNSPKGFTK